MNLYNIFNFVYGCWYMQAQSWVDYGSEDQETVMHHYLSIFGRRFHWVSEK